MPSKRAILVISTLSLGLEGILWASASLGFKVRQQSLSTFLHSYVEVFSLCTETFHFMYKSVYLHKLDFLSLTTL